MSVRLTKECAEQRRNAAKRQKQGICEQEEEEEADANCCYRLSLNVCTIPKILATMIRLGDV